MAPEALLHGRISKAADVYSFGITLWEMFTGAHAYAGVPRALLGHQVAVSGMRPVFPSFTPRDYKTLAEACWNTDPEKRYTGE
jgi:serine/threonine protein kinase